MSKTIVNRKTKEVLMVELELGDDIWVRDQRGHTTKAHRTHFPLERWQFNGTSPLVDDVPVRLAAPATPATRSEAQ